MMGKSVFFSEGTAGQMKSAPSFAKDDDSTLPKEPNGSKIGLGPKPIWGMSVQLDFDRRLVIRWYGCKPLNPGLPLQFAGIFSTSALTLT
jgi:hypothetical protein